MTGCQPRITTASPFSGSEPHTTGPMPACSSGTASRTAAPAPSAKITQVVRSVQSRTSDIRSAPITRARVAAPARIAWSAVASAYEKPEQTVFRS